MATVSGGSQNAPVGAPPASDEIANEAKRWVEYAVGEAISFKLAVSAALDATVISARFALSEVLSASSDSIQEAQDLGKLVKNEYTAYEDLVVEKIKEGIYVAASHPGLSSAVVGGVGLVVLKRPRSFLIRNTRRLFLSEESMLADAESKVNELRQSINLIKNESRKLEERAIKAEEEMEQGRKALIVEGRGIQAELNFVRKIEREILGLKDLIHELPQREASRYRSMREKETSGLYRLQEKETMRFGIKQGAEPSCRSRLGIKTWVLYNYCNLMSFKQKKKGGHGRVRRRLRII